MKRHELKTLLDAYQKLATLEKMNENQRKTIISLEDQIKKLTGEEPSDEA